MEINYKKILENLLHEVESLNSATKISAEILSKASSQNDRQAVAHHADIIFENSVLFSTHLDIVNFEVNPKYISDVEKFEKRNIHGRFHKAVLAFKRVAKEKKIIINMIGKVTSHIDSKPVIDTLAVLILDNAIKYSTQEGEIDIEFDERKNEIEVQITNLGPYIPKEEMNLLFERGYRSENAIKTENPGKGYGLNFIKFICEIHQAKLNIFSSENIVMINKIPYSEFIINILFQKNI